ncbi:MAG: alpha/beta family hydrolase [Actinocatenispora sp.]
MTVPTSRGTAEADLALPAAPRSLLVLGHGAGGGVDAPDLVAVRAAALDAQVAVVRVTQPYRVLGRRAPAPAQHLDDAFTEVVGEARTAVPDGLPLVVGGRSSGARVACRTAGGLGAVGVLALAFPLHPPGRPEKSRQSELPVGTPTLVVNGDRDPFGVPGGSDDVRVVVRPGERHGLTVDPAAVGTLVTAWLAEHGWAAPAAR